MPEKTTKSAQSGIAPVLVVASILTASLAGHAHGIEMFTFFGDGSRIGLPSLEVPVEAYPGIPLRSDRIRGRDRGPGRWFQQRERPTARPAPGMREKTGVPAGGIRIRPMEAESREWPVAPSPPE